MGTTRASEAARRAVSARHRRALASEILDPNLTAPRHGRVIGAKSAEAMPDEHAEIARPAHAARAFGEVPAALAHGTPGAQTIARRRRGARTSLARDGRERALVLFGSGSSGASHSCRT
jgi:hypothetical protein